MSATITPSKKLNNLVDLTKDLKGEKWLAHSFPGIIIVYEIIKVTPRTVTMRSTKSGKVVRNEEYRTYKTAVSDDNGRTMTKRISSHHTLRVGNYAHAGTFYIPEKINGEPIEMMDWTY